MPFLTLLGLFKDATPPTADTFEEHINRKFKTGLISPFAVNVGMVLYECDTSQEVSRADLVRKPPGVVWPGKFSQHMVQLILKESPLAFPFSKFHLVPLEDFKSHYAGPIQCNLDQICSSSGREELWRALPCTPPRLLVNTAAWDPFQYKDCLSRYRNKDCHYKSKTVSHLSYLFIRNSCAGKTVSLFWYIPLGPRLHYHPILLLWTFNFSKGIFKANLMSLPNPSLYKTILILKIMPCTLVRYICCLKQCIWNGRLTIYHWNHISGWLLTHWGWNKMVVILQTAFWRAFSSMKMYEFWLKFHWSLFLNVQLTIFQHWFR